MIEMSLEFESDVSAANASLQNRLEQALQTALNLRIPVHPLPPGSLPRFEMKAQRWVKIMQ